jgi:hypothetical protein
MKRKLFVAGCSISDYTDIEHPYGEVLSELLNFDYVHEGAGAGSNSRIWRKITDHVLNGNLTQNDLLIVQYTEVTRTEFWSALAPAGIKDTSPPGEPYCDGGRVIRWKPYASAWQPNKEEVEFFEQYEKYFVSVEFAKQNFRVNNYNFQQMLKNHNINVVFLTTTRILNPDYQYITDHFLPNEFKDNTSSDKTMNLRTGDTCHFSQLGHNITANKLKLHIEKLGL